MKSDSQLGNILLCLKVIKNTISMQSRILLFYISIKVNNYIYGFNNKEKMVILCN